MLGFILDSRTHPISSIPITNSIRQQQTIPNRKPTLLILPIQTPNFPHSQLKSRRQNPRGFNASFSEDKEESNLNGGSDDAEDEEDLSKNGGNDRPRLNLRWSELLLDPDPDNVVAAGLTGVLAWASARVLWQLLVITMAVLSAAVKYAFVAVVLIFIVITLL